MYTEYRDKLISCLENTILFQGDTREEISSYEEMISSLVSLFLQVKQEKRQIFFVGNGGSAGIASHMTADFMKNGEIGTYSLYDSSMLTCMGNDYGYEFIFSKQLEHIGKPRDLLVAISSSGNSQNMVNAIGTAREKKMRVLTLSGFRADNKIKAMGDFNLYVPVEHYGMVESIHTLILQQVVDEIK
ncbi:MAG: SIS domain-containing protein [Lachnospiraceae bacterium]